MSTTPTTLGKYQIIREIARSNDIVYEAYDALMNRRVALKELNLPHSVTGPQREERVKRFEREVKAAGSLAHPNIVTIYEVGEDAGRNFMAMEYLDGHTLRNELDTKGFLPTERAIEIATEVLSGLTYAHEHGVIHRDIKPENIQILDSGRVKITDFGIARLTFEPNLTIDGQVFGTPSYMSPEQVVGKDIDVRSDLFSVGIILYEMLGGMKPFKGDSVVSISYAIMNSEPEVLNQVPPALWGAIRRALDKSPQMRFSSATEFIDALDGLNQPAPAPVYPNMPTAMPMPPPVLGPAPQAQYPTAYPPQYGQPYPTQYGQPTQYGHPTQYGQPYGAPQQTYQPSPVYYPPPPRQPLLKAETRAFLGRLFWTLLVVGTLFTLLIVGIQSVTSAMGRHQAENRDSQVLEAASRAKTPDDKIQALRNALPNIESSTMRSEANKELADLLIAHAMKDFGGGNTLLAEANLKAALEYNPDRAEIYGKLGEIYAGAARSTPDLNKKRELWEEGARYYEAAVARERSASFQKDYAQNAAMCRRNGGLRPDQPLAPVDQPTAPVVPGENVSRESVTMAEQLYNEALVLKNNGQNSEAREKLFEARKYAPVSSTIAAKIEEKIEQLVNPDRG